jgi:arginase family enzyme
LDDVGASLTEFAKNKNLLGLDVSQYNPDKDPGANGASKIVDLLVNALAARREAIASASESGAATA